MGARGQKMLQNFLQKNWKTKYAKSNNIWIIYTDNINENILAVLRTHKEDNFQSCNYWTSLQNS